MRTNKLIDWMFVTWALLLIFTWLCSFIITIYLILIDLKISFISILILFITTFTIMITNTLLEA